MTLRATAWNDYDAKRPVGGVSARAAFNAGWAAAVEAAAQIADDWTHHGDPAVAMYASPRIRDKIKRELAADGETPNGRKE